MRVTRVRFTVLAALFAKKKSDMGHSENGAAAIEEKTRRLSLSDRRQDHRDEDLDEPGEKRIKVPLESEEVIPLVVRALDRILSKNMQLISSGQMEDKIVTVFHTKVDPGVTMTFYLKRMYTYGKLSPCCFLVALILLDRVVRSIQGLVLTNFNVHRLYVTCVLISTKFLDDLFFSNAHWAKIAGLGIAEMNSLELDILALLDWRVHVEPAEYLQYRTALMALPPDPLSARPAGQLTEQQLPTESPTKK